MEYRKIQKTGGSSYAISLPKEWIKVNSLNEGDSVGVKVLSSGELLVFPLDKEGSMGDYLLQIDGKIEAEHLLRTLIAVYLRGYDGVILKEEPMIDEDARKTVKAFTSVVVGVEIMEERSDAIVLRDLMGSPDVEPMRILSRMSSMAEAGLSDVRSSSVIHNPSLLREVIERDSQIDKLYLLTARQFNKALARPLYAETLGTDVKSLSEARNVAKQIERIGDHVESAASLLLEYGKPLGRPGLDELFDASVQFFHEAFQAFSDADGEASQELIDRIERSTSKFMLLLKQYESSNTVYELLLAEDLIRVMFYSSDIAEAAIDLSVR
ncbi:MAG: PhoU domain-containing protein [Thermoprotei archaeon]